MIHLTISSRYHYPMVGFSNWIKTLIIVPELIVFSFILFFLLFGLRNKRICYLFAVYSCLVFSMLLAYYFIVDQKILLFISFFFAITAIVNWYFMYTELNLACYEPHFNQSPFMRTVCMEIACSIILKSKNRDEVDRYSGLLTNWDENSCYLKLNQFTDIFNFNEGELVQLEIDFFGRLFEADAYIVSYSKKLNGVGLKLKAKDSDEKNGYNRFIELVNNLGLVKSQLR